MFQASASQFRIDVCFSRDVSLCQLDILCITLSACRLRSHTFDTESNTRLNNLSHEDVTWYVAVGPETVSKHHTFDNHSTFANNV